jgi:hypothetical protein
VSHWELTEDWGFHLGSWARKMIVEAVDDSLPELKHDLPGRTPWRVRADHDAAVLVLVWEAGTPSSVNTFGKLEDGEFATIKTAAGGKRSYEELRAQPDLAPYYSQDSFLWVGAIHGGKVHLAELQQQLMDWLNDEPLAAAERLNAERVRRALPEPPRYAVEAITKACWVLESQSACAQGTAFKLEGYGFVTCEHVIHDDAGVLFADIELFHSSNPSARFAVREVVANDALDLAIFQADTPDLGALQANLDANLALQSHVAVCGFPNYRLGDTCTLSPGVVVAHRMARGGVRRYLTNAGIVAGMSGGPALACGDEVIGVCVTGAPWMQATRETEDQAIVPISALDLLMPRK